MLKKIFKNNFFRGSMVFTVASFLANILNYIFNLLAARSFTLSAYGEYMTAVSYIVLFSVPFGAINILLIKRIGATNKNERLGYILLLEKWVYLYVKKHIFQFLIGITTIILILTMKANLSLASAMLVIGMSSITLFNIIYISALQAFKKFLQTGLVSFMIGLLKITGIVLVIWLFPTLPYLYLVLFFSTFISLIFARKLVLSSSKNHKKLSYKLMSPLSYLKKRSVIIPLLATLGLVGMLSVDMMLVKKFFIAEEVGLYAGLVLLGKIILYVTYPLSIVAYTFFTGSETKKNSRKVLLITTLMVLFIGLVAFVFYRFFPELVVNIIFGNKFLVISGQVWLAAIYGSVYSLLNLYAQYFISKTHSISLLSLLALLVQSLGIVFFHDNFFQVLFVSVSSMSVLLLIYLLVFVTRIVDKKK